MLAYLERIKKYARCSDSCFVVALIYIDRLIETQNVVLTSLNVHRLVITSLMLAAKFFDDLFYNNAFYAKLGGTHILMLSYRNITTKKTPSHHTFHHLSPPLSHPLSPPLFYPGVNPAEMNTLEIELLHLLNFSLMVRPDVFAKYQAELRNFNQVFYCSMTADEPSCLCLRYVYTLLLTY